MISSKGGETIDYYQILGVSKSATQKEIKEKYKQLALETHPDRSKHPDANRRMAQINEAYEILRDPEKRKKYDERQQKIGAFESKQQKEPRSGRNSQSSYGYSERQSRNTQSSYGYSERQSRKYKAPFRKKAVFGLFLFFIVFGGWILVYGNEESPSSLDPKIRAEKFPETAEMFNKRVRYLPKQRTLSRIRKINLITKILSIKSRSKNHITLANMKLPRSSGVK
jgi:curved DNA-binding protein CbpA